MDTDTGVVGRACAGGGVREAGVEGRKMGGKGDIYTYIYYYL